MQSSSDHESSHPNQAMSNAAPRAPHPIVPAAQLHQPPDRLADLVTCMVDLLAELYRQPNGNAPYAADGDPRLRAAITRLQRLEGSLEELTAEATSVHQIPPRAVQETSRRPSAPSPASSDRGEWVAAGMGR